MSTHRRILLLAHPTRLEARELVGQVTAFLGDAGIEVVEAPEREPITELGNERAVLADADAAKGCELVLVLGGDGTILRAAEITRTEQVPILGVNLGHVGFLAEAERVDLPLTLSRIVDRSYAVEERLALEVTASIDGIPFAHSWALNEVSIEKSARERMLELTVEVDGRPLSTWGCDGVVIATPTGSTAYAFSAGGPIMWPDVHAIMLVPNSAHALFARPIIVGEDSRLAIEVIAENEGSGVMWCDGRRHAALPPRARIDVDHSPEPVRLARLDNDPFTDRLVEKFHLDVHGWRGASRNRDGVGTRP